MPLTSPTTPRIMTPYNDGGVCMSGKVCLRKQGRPTWFVRWWDRKEKKEYRVESYPGHGKMFQTSTNERHDNGFILANKLLAMMQAVVMTLIS